MKRTLTKTQRADFVSRCTAGRRLVVDGRTFVVQSQGEPVFIRDIATGQTYRLPPDQFAAATFPQPTTHPTPP